jgi:transcription elongation factor Elf1
MICNVIENEPGVKGSYPAKSKSKFSSERELEFRCPQCFKLYKTVSSDIYSSEPEFECEACHAQFSFSYPPMNPKAIYTKSLSLPQVGKLAKKSIPTQKASLRQRPNVEVKKEAGRELLPEFLTCANCGSTNPRGVQDCYRCGVVLSKAHIQATHMGLPSLVKMWQDLLQDYDNMTKHLAFVDRCEDLQALPFALKKYKDLKVVKPQDSLATQMINSVVIRVVTSQARRISKWPGMGWTAKIKDLPWKNMFRATPLFLGLSLVVLGILKFANPNFVGGGAAILSLYLGTLYFYKGRVAWKDIWPP